MINQYEFAGWLGVANKSYSWMLLGLYVVQAMFADQTNSYKTRMINDYQVKFTRET